MVGYPEILLIGLSPATDPDLSDEICNNEGWSGKQSNVRVVLVSRRQ